MLCICSKFFKIDYFWNGLLLHVLEQFLTLNSISQNGLVTLVNSGWYAICLIIQGMQLLEFLYFSIVNMVYIVFDLLGSNYFWFLSIYCQSYFVYAGMGLIPTQNLCYCKIIVQSLLQFIHWLQVCKIPSDNYAWSIIMQAVLFKKVT